MVVFDYLKTTHLSPVFPGIFNFKPQLNPEEVCFKHFGDFPVLEQMTLNISPHSGHVSQIHSTPEHSRHI